MAMCCMAGCMRMSLGDKNGVEDVVPDLAGHPEAEIEVLVVVRKMVLLHLVDVCG